MRWLDMIHLDSLLETRRGLLQVKRAFPGEFMKSSNLPKLMKLEAQIEAELKNIDISDAFQTY